MSTNSTTKGAATSGGGRPAVARRRSTSKIIRQRRFFTGLKWFGVVFFVSVTVLPLLYGVMLSLRSIESVAADPGAIIPKRSDLTLDAYREVLRSVDAGGQGFLLFLRNSAIIAVITVIAALVIALPGAYALGRLNFVGRRQISFLFLAIYLFPAILLAIPMFVIFTRIGLRGTLAGLIIVYISQTVPITIYMLRNYFESLPASLEEAAAIDGCSRLQILRYVSLPLAKPALMSTGLFVFMVAWNEFLFALLFLVDKRERWTVSLGLSQLSGSIEVAPSVLLAGSVLLTVPVIVVFFLAERLLVEGLTAGAEKG